MVDDAQGLVEELRQRLLVARGEDRGEPVDAAGGRVRAHAAAQLLSGELVEARQRLGFVICIEPLGAHESSVGVCDE